MSEKIKAIFWGERRTYRLWQILACSLGIFMSTVSARMSHEQFKGRFGQIPYIPETWRKHVVSQADAYAIALTIAIFVFSVLFFYFSFGGFFNVMSFVAKKFYKNSDPGEDDALVYAANGIIQTAIAVALGAIVYMMMSFSWAQTNMIGTESRTTREAREVIQHPTVKREQTLLNQKQHTYEKVAQRASDAELGRLERKANKARRDGRFYRAKADVAQTANDIYNETIYRNIFNEFYQSAVKIETEIASRRQRLASAEADYGVYAQRVNAVTDSVFQSGQVAKAETDYKTGPMLEYGIFMCALLTYVLGAFVRGHFETYTPGVKSIVTSIARVKNKIEIEGDEGTTGGSGGGGQHVSRLGDYERNTPLTSEEMIEILKQSGDFEIKPKDKPPFQVCRNAEKQKEILRDWLMEQYDAGANPSDGSKNSPGVQGIITKFCNLPKTNTFEFAHEVYDEFKKTNEIERAAEAPAELPEAIGNLSDLKVFPDGIGRNGE